MVDNKNNVLSTISIKKAITNEDFIVGKTLFIEYSNELQIDLCFQNFENELQNISTQYGQSSGSLILVFYNNLPIGCVGVRKISNEIAELKRMYVHKDYRLNNIGENILKKAIEEAKNLGYQKIRLDTLETMQAAIYLYHKIGFKEIDAYTYNPIQGAKFYELSLL